MKMILHTSLRRMLSTIALLVLINPWPVAALRQTDGLPAGVGLQELIDAASAGDSVVIGPGRYEGNIILEKRITLIGLGEPFIRGTGVGSVITVNADSCEIRGFKVVRSGSQLAEENSGILLQSKHNIVRENVLEDVLFGIYLFGADSNDVRDNVILGKEGLQIGERGSGIHVWNSYHNVFYGNKIRRMRDGFYIQYATHTLIEECEASELRYGLHYMYADSNVFLRNSFHDNLAGAAVMYSEGIRMTGNTFSHNRGFSSYGILFQDCHGLVADSNIIADNGTGMFMEASTQNVFRHNIFAQNDVALQMFQNSTENVFTENDFVENLSPLMVIGPRTDSYWSLDGRGNYWSSYGGYDLDDDEVGDVPMKIQNVFQYIEGQNPGARLYLYSPASQALALAARTFPVLDMTREIDEHPLMHPQVLGMLSEKRVSEPLPGGLAGFGWTILPAAGLLFGGVTLLHRKRGRR